MAKAAKTLSLAPGVVIIPAWDDLPAMVTQLRGALAVVSDDARVVAAVQRDCRLPVFSDLAGANAYAKRAAKMRNGRISAVVPNYNYGRFICDAINSLLTQTMHVSEIIVADDGSTDGSVDTVRAHFGDVTRLRIIEMPANSGNVGGPRNAGIAAATGEFIITLDSDDMLEPEYAEVLFDCLKAHPDAGVAYTGVQIHNEDTGERWIVPNWPVPFEWAWSMGKEPDGTPHNCIPTASMFRREMWARAGGYDAGRTCAEDAEFWTRALSTGWRAVKSTESPLFVYRRHGNSMSSRPVLPLNAWSSLYRGHTPLAAPVSPAERTDMRDYTRPLVSVIIPVGPGHGAHLPTALHSLLAQTFWNFEVIVVNDSGEKLPLAPHPFVRVSDTGPRAGAGAARNTGLALARAPLCFFLDADDYILPRTLEQMIKRYAHGDAGYVYSGWQFIRKGQAPEKLIAGEWTQDAWASYESRGLHGVSVLMATEDAMKIGGFDQTMSGFEDWEFFVRCTIAGLCGACVPEALLAYRLDTGQRREHAAQKRDEVVAYLRAHHGDYIEGRTAMSACCGGNLTASEQAAKELASAKALLPFEIDSDGAVLMEYVGRYEAPVTYFGRYSGCKTCEPARVDAGDVARMEATGAWRVKPAMEPHTPQPAAIYPDP
jgi:glycosyltransferase involved in cell wall biosynthesis